MAAPPPQLIDPFQRRLNYLRISVTDRCNLRCTYCMPRSGVPKLDHAEILRYEEILRLAHIGVGLGITKIRLTGGEPLVRKGILEFLPRLAAIQGLRDLSLTTNGILLGQNLEKIRAAGIRRINVSLDTLVAEKYARITGVDGFHRVWEALMEARETGFSPIKVNVVVMKGINSDEIPAFAALSRKEPFHIRFIEYMPMGCMGMNQSRRFVPTERIKERLKELGPLIPVPRGPDDGPSERFRFPGARGEVGFISPVSHHFCRSCNRLRLTASGHLRPCLLSDRQLDLKGPLRRGATDRELAEIFKKAALKKPFEHTLRTHPGQGPRALMSSIGG
ncbi:MAG: GTP 3',8-cyclase MoaA [Deltaproteobacteria bacterium]|nr:GTP 3',8-cyclase MoaA [Deltaproteobacteria bacterium]MBW1922506.1 GTP 3',8-cyclase MoaA [Deltaproteobacteria bacterium]MBW2006594.1 GTP 3',8-cyclase MoaA [Deltaproteobacteria bacterium]MBW2102296.1 GTP 3',8-cyclase MoaA [Deltaproteobacteria bacterium]MBW2347788.1 GTP 3',8-cyclase MoaA [Deltaproteobacteria bacterium]